MKMTRSEAGKLGAEKSKETWQTKIKDKIAEYDLNPKLCAECLTPLPYKDRSNKFCSKSCSAIHNNQKRCSKLKSICRNCGIEYMAGRTSEKIYCSNDCQRDYEYKQRIDEWLTTGEKASRAATKKYLFEVQDGKCAHCGTPSTWNGKPLVFDLEHKDGNSENNVRENLELICPNCHSQTDTYKGKNRGNGRHFRMKRYYSGKSY